MDNELSWNIISSYFNGKHLERLVRHQLESYNKFINEDLNNTIDMFNPVTIHSEHDKDEENYEVKKWRHVKYFPIPDRKVPEDKKAFRAMLKTVLKKKERIYIFCQGGHGRSGLTAACLLIETGNYTAEEALKAVKSAHKTRADISDKMKKLGSPQTAAQKKFVKEY